MDIATLIGFLATFGLIVMAMGDPMVFLDMPSVYIVVLGTLTAVLARSSIPEFIGGITGSLKALLHKEDKPEDLIEQLTNLGTIARKDGMIALEGQEIDNPFLSKAVSMLVDGTDPAIIKSSLDRELASTKMRHAMGAKIFSAWGEIAPAMGMIGTLIGLVQMLGNMGDPKSIGPAMAVALLTTMYGAILANVICLPIAMKLENQAELEAANNELIIEGILFIQDGGNPRVLSDFLASFLGPKARAKLAAA